VSQEYLRRMLWMVSFLRRSMPARWARRTIINACGQESLFDATRDAKPENLYWWMIEAGCHMNPYFWELPRSLRVMFKFICQQLTGYIPDYS
jgi:hypothetical protein